MRHLTTAEILSEQIDFHDICILPVREPLGQEGLFHNKKRHCNVLFMYIGGRREYHPFGGEPFFLNPGEILYVPKHSSYRFHIIEALDDGRDYAIAINFDMTDRGGESVCLGDAPQVMLRDSLSHYFSRFQRALSMDSGDKYNVMLLKSVVYSICYEVFSERHNNEASRAPWRAIAPAIDLIESQPSADIPIPQLARQCGVSETRFRQLFSQYTGGESAVQYRNRLRIEQVERLLRTEQVTVEYAARETGFRDMSHFYRLYKKYKSQ